MNLISPISIKNLLDKYKTRPSKIMGQNFLVDQAMLDKIIETANLSQKDVVLEIGPGVGTLTKELVKRVKKVIAIEKDAIMTEILKETVKDFRNVEVVNTDILKIFNSQLSIFNKFSKKYKVVANIPYYLTSPLIRKLLESDNSPSEIILMVQKEVAQRISAKPPKMSLLAISVQFYAKAEIVSYVSHKSFWPSPKVDSAIIKITPNQSELLLRLTSQGLFFKIVKAGFSQPRKQLVNNLSKALKKDKSEITKWLLKNKINPQQRAETLNIENWINLASSFKL